MSASGMEERQDVEWAAFRAARDRRREQARLAAALAELRRREGLHRKYDEASKAHEEELAAYTVRVESQVARQPMTLSTRLTSLRSTERILMSTGHYEEAAEAHAMFNLLEQSEREAAEERKRQIVENKLLAKQRELNRRDLSSYRKVLIAQQLNSMHEDAKIRTVEKNLQHKATEMAMTHYDQRRALNLPFLVPRVFDKTNQLKAARGTQLKKLVNGDHYYVPSLCSVYEGFLGQV
ncbi:uncharacterized protein TM35_000421810 [Trypanosoma theileri]|uniref:Uncharacterized protein n=1 Tax=Trypanosoma theileri TaxID=67003 RepID=A0A1X0NJT6_9TRYP|nr:uncharacterized protein TM35_000421810 [Trypanosoma theileri]ORC84723.1 hypothetical protein TM35_000421810 [Trypanosoma theileri]